MAVLLIARECRLQHVRTLTWVSWQVWCLPPDGELPTIRNMMSSRCARRLGCAAVRDGFAHRELRHGCCGLSDPQSDLYHMLGFPRSVAQRMRNLLPLRNIPISITVDGVEVHGEILSLHPNDISVVITSPVSGLGNAVHIPHSPWRAMPCGWLADESRHCLRPGNGRMAAGAAL
jgi:hypothetical protein